jgi:nitrogen fixation protein FixH
MQESVAAKPLTGRMVLLWILLFFGVVISVNVTMMTLAIKTLPGTDDDNAYADGLAYNKAIAAARAQDARLWQVTAHVERDADGLGSIAVSARDATGAALLGLSFSAHLERPADRRADLSVALSDRGAGSYRGSIEAVAAGQWELVLEGDRGAERMFLSRNRIDLR